jgi:uncharacterized protein YbaP (TraB family)
MRLSFEAIILSLILTGVTPLINTADTDTVHISNGISLPVSRYQDSLANHTLLWEISGKDLSGPSYLFGTMHILCDSLALLSDELKGRIDSCTEVYFEIDLDNMKEMLQVMRYVQMDSGVVLSDLISAEEYGRIEKYFSQHNTALPFFMLKRMKPFFVSSLLEEQSMDCPQKKGMEQVIMAEAKKNKKPIHGLESASFQASLFDSIPYRLQARELLNYVDSISYYKGNAQQMAQVYRQQDLSRLDSLVQKSDPSMDKYMDLLLYGRNRNWVSKMPAIMQKSKVLFAVGAGHLVGEQGLISLLRAQGYTLTPLPNTWK